MMERADCAYIYFQIREGRLQGVGQCLSREYRMVCHVLKGDISKDFVEVLSTFSHCIFFLLKMSLL